MKMEQKDLLGLVIAFIPPFIGFVGWLLTRDVATALLMVTSIALSFVVYLLVKVLISVRDVESLKVNVTELHDNLLKEPQGKITWTRFWFAVQELQEKVEADPSFDAEVVVSVGRSGAVAGALLAGNLGEKRHIGTDRVNHKEGGIRRTEIVPSITVFAEELVGKQVLLVMAECHAGETLATAREDIGRVEGIRAVKTAALFRRRGARFRPDYVAVDNAEYGDLPFRTRTWQRSSQY